MLRSIDHVVLTVADIDATIRFSVDGLGAELVRFGERRLAIQIGDQKLNLHRVASPIEPHSVAPTPGAVDICFTTDLTPQAVLARLHIAGIAVNEGPVARTGARGPITSVYCRDPDGNLVEIATYGEDSLQE